MSEEIERRLRAAGGALPGPEDSDTAAARARFLGSEVSKRRPGRRRTAALALAFAVAIGGAFGVGYALASGGSTTKTRIVQERQRLDAGPGFLPAAGWDSVASGTATPVLSAAAANVPLAAADRALTGPPAETARHLGRNGVLLYARFGPTSPQERLPQRLLPLRLDEARAAGSYPGLSPAGSLRRLHVRVAAYDVDVVVAFGAAQPSAAVLAAAREELGRLAVPACPAALPLAAGDVAAAKAHVLRWLPAHYPGEAADVVGATATAAAGAGMPRHGEAAHDCGERVAGRSVEVEVTLPRLAKLSASLSQLGYFVAKTADGWFVWERVR